MVPLLKLIATLSAAFFAGGGLFVSIVIYRAIMMDMASAVALFGRIYNKAAPWQGSNAIVCLVAAVIVSALSGDWWWAIGGLLVGASVPFTLLVMMKHWGELHWVRNVLSTAGLVVMLARVLY
jgi:hypothetical protein